MLGVSLINPCYAEAALGSTMRVPLYWGVVLVSACGWIPYGVVVVWYWELVTN